MEIMLAIAVVAAVVLFGALISMGNERQRKAIDNLREQLVLWAMQDLKIKRERLACDVKIDDPTGWLNKVASKALGYHPNLQVAKTYAEPQALVCAAGDGSRRVVFSALSPNEIRKLGRGERNRLLKYANGNPLLALPRKVNVYEFSALNCGLLFDLELPLAWNHLTHQNANQMERLWMYVI